MHSIKKIGQSFWYITPVSLTDRPILGMVAGTNKTLMIDAGNSEDHANYFIQRTLKHENTKPDLVVLTHWHWDHIFGLPALSDSVSIASAKTRKEMEKLVPFSWSDEAIDERVREGTEIEFCAKAIKEEYQDHRDIQVVLPDVTFDQRMEIDLGGVTCVVQHVGGDHAADSAIVYVKEEKILFLGDCIYPKMYAERVHYTVKEILRLLDELEAFDADTYIPSHQRPWRKEEFRQETDKLRMIAKFTDQCGGDKQKITKEYQHYVNRELKEDELETIAYFVNGY
ncbi:MULTISPECIES: MBL fold metallo-hydrolase [Bacillus]|uniref:MBL fold metallo-hydrolase n=1 Tax=Bacillus TaxID=1386 RepID=UPI000E720608|nr:MBL fold metallo-hydrolase [Bacillus safensis]MCY1093060.1 MBL fold metallo-hydrolase [Bacillus safensis]MCY7469217.1 MBL fold metallo-hydrolase [Bacillus safensis]RKE66241.1 glyoxylase-like metal-dependent hydrolase (beta-lactamase superfamily II) [Bacillus safensis]GLF86923.1 Zn-dependent hydrolase [Bacillus safensis]